MNVNSLRSKIVRTVSPALCVGMLLGAAHLQRAWPVASDSAAFHARAVEAVRAIPLRIESLDGTEVEPPPAAIDVLQPNVIRTIEFTDASPAALTRPGDRIWLSIVECGRAGDMLGHFPPKCYPAYGDKLLDARPRTWLIPASPGTTAAAVGAAKPMRIDGMEYRFELTSRGRAYRRIVYNFMVAPRRGIVPDMKGLGEAAEDYRRRYLGASQVQVVFVTLAGEESAEATRDEVFSTLMRATGPALEVLKSGE